MAGPLTCVLGFHWESFTEAFQIIPHDTYSNSDSTDSHSIYWAMLPLAAGLCALYPGSIAELFSAVMCTQELAAFDISQYMGLNSIPRNRVYCLQKLLEDISMFAFFPCSGVEKCNNWCFSSDKLSQNVLSLQTPK